MKYRNNLSDLSENACFIVRESFEVLVPVGIFDTQTFVGRSMMLGKLYRRVTLLPGDILFDTFGGVYATHDGKTFESTISLSEKHPFEKNYDQSYATWPVDKLLKTEWKKLPACSRDLPRVARPTHSYGRGIDAIES